MLTLLEYPASAEFTTCVGKPPYGTRKRAKEKAEEVENIINVRLPDVSDARPAADQYRAAVARSVNAHEALFLGPCLGASLAFHGSDFYDEAVLAGIYEAGQYYMAVGNLELAVCYLKIVWAEEKFAAFMIRQYKILPELARESLQLLAEEQGEDLLNGYDFSRIAAILRSRRKQLPGAKAGCGCVLPFLLFVGSMSGIALAIGVSIR